MMWKREMLLSILAGFIFFCGCSNTAEKHPPADIVTGELALKLDKYLTRITPFGFSGALLVAKDGEIILNKGYGLAIRDQAIPNTSQTVFSTGSITKQFTAAAIMKLEMMGKLNTADSIGKYFDDVPDDKAKITLHHLLTHTSGVIGYTGEHDYEEIGRDSAIAVILNSPLHFPPGDEFEYSNAGYSMLAAIVALVSGQSYEDFLDENLFAPAGMLVTGYRNPDWSEQVVAHWYNGQTDNGTPLDKPYPYWNLLGNGGILSTTDDMYRWHLALMGDSVLSAAAKAKMYTPFLNEYGYGWDIIGREMGTLIQHDGGSMLGNSAEFRRYIDADVVTMLFCNQSYHGHALFQPIRDNIENLVFGGDVAIPPAVQDIASEQLNQYAGMYNLSSDDSLKIDIVDNNLHITPWGQGAIDALFFAGSPGETAHRDLNSWSAGVFDAALRGDYTPFSNLLKDANRLERFRDFINMRLRRYADETGTIVNAKAHGTFPTDIIDDAVETIVEYAGESGSLYFRLLWSGGKIAAMAPAMGVPETTIPLRLLEGRSFVGYDLGMARVIGVRFLTDDAGDVTDLAFGTGDGGPTARKSD